MKKRNYLLIFIMCIAITFCFTGCKNKEDNLKENEDKTNIESTEKQENKDNNYIFAEIDYSKPVYTVAQIKEEYDLNPSQYEFKPLYNVNKDTKFTFHFNSEVDPILAVTVHTDSKCEANSTILQYNEGYLTNEGVDVIVVPPETLEILECEERSDYNENEKYVWGNAPIYYLCVRYDLDSPTVKKLDDPIVIPFTLKNKISTPYAYSEVDETGNFTIMWDEVENAVSYNIYQVMNSSKEFAANEIAYSSVRPRLKTTLKSDINSYSGEWYRYGSENSDLSEDLISIKYDTLNKNCILEQNSGMTGSFYITAVDKNGNESFFSNEVSTRDFIKYLPKKIEYASHGYVEGKYYIDEFLDEIEVSSVSSSIFNGDKVSVKYPISYKKVGQPKSYNNTCDYEYKVDGTLLSGVISYHSTDGIFPDEHKSNKSLNRVEMPKPPKGETIPSNVGLFVDEDYSNASIDLSVTKEYPSESKLKYSAAYLYMRSDMLLARLMGGSFDETTGYGEFHNPLEIESYVIPEDYSTKVEEIRDESGNLTGYVLKEFGNMTHLAVRYYDENKKLSRLEVNPNPDYKKPAEKTFEERKVSEEPAKVITSTNFIEEQRKSTQKQVTVADKDEVQGTNFPVVAKTAGQKYLAMKLINQEENISLKAFPSYQNVEELYDDLLYVWYQNPYIMGIDVSLCSYDYENQVIQIKYNVDKETAEKQQKAVYEKATKVVSEIITKNMTDAEKSIAIYNYLQDNSAYNTDAFDYAMNGGADFYTKYANSWNTYGILCEEIGVCQSYAYAYNVLANLCGLETVMVTGSLNNGGHAWNAIKIDGKWYMLDVTNNGKAMDGVDYWICNSSTDFIEQNGFVLDDGFVMGTDMSEYKNSDNSNDWYTLNDVAPENIAECAKIWKNNKENKNIILMKYDLGTVEMQKKFWNSFKEEAKKIGVNDTEFAGWKAYSFSGILMLKKVN